MRMVTGRKPYDADTPLAVIIKQAATPCRHPNSLCATYPNVERVIFKVLAKNPEDRFQSMTEFATTLEMIGQGKKVYWSNKNTRQYLLFASVIATAAVIIGVIAFLFSDQITQGKFSLASIPMPQIAQVGQSPTPYSTPTFDLIVAAQRIQAATQTQMQSLLLTRYAQETIIALTPTTTPTITLTPTKTLTPTPTHTLFPTSVPQQFYIPGNVEGVRFVAKTDGVYRFTIVSEQSIAVSSNPYYGWKTSEHLQKSRYCVESQESRWIFRLLNPDYFRIHQHGTVARRSNC